MSPEGRETAPEQLREATRDVLVHLADDVRAGFPPAERTSSEPVLPSDVRAVADRNPDSKKALKNAGVVTAQLVKYRDLHLGMAA